MRTRRCVVFFDEFDAIGKERSDEHETGEIKRVVSSLLLNVDALPSYVVVVTATNHPELLDRAVWRRFQLRLELPPPNLETIAEWLRRFEGAARSSWDSRRKTDRGTPWSTELRGAGRVLHRHSSAAGAAGCKARPEVRCRVATAATVRTVSGSEIGNGVAAATAPHLAARLGKRSPRLHFAVVAQPIRGRPASWNALRRGSVNSSRCSRHIAAQSRATPLVLLSSKCWYSRRTVP